MKKTYYILLITILNFSFVLAQDVTMPNIFGNNMVLQQNSIVSLWGWAPAKTRIRILPSWGSSVIVSTGNDGKWKSTIKTPKASPGKSPQYTISIKGPSNELIFKNILVGEVWLCSGQSNMSFGMNYHDSMGLGVVDYKNEISKANFPTIRLFKVQNGSAETPQINCFGEWKLCAPSSVSSFSAVGYYFARELIKHRNTNVPIGLIQSAYGGSSIQAWMKKSILLQDTAFKNKYLNDNSTKPQTKPSQVYNAMIAPIIPYTIKGVIWYQGESNAADGSIYTKANIALINDWRVDWGRKLSFYAVQLTPRFWSKTQTKDNGTNRAMFREIQSNIQCLPKTGIVVTSDLLQSPAERTAVHPQMKKEIGERLAYWALAKDYGLNVQYLGPLYKKNKIEGGKIRIYFELKSIGSGLKTKDGKDISCFKIAGEDKKFYPANAVFEGNSIVVSAPEVKKPVAVRYAFTDGALTNLINKEGIAAFPFRTDSWVNATIVNE